jgi:hypothetical protein
MTYNQILADIEAWANNHLQIQTFGNGEEWEVNGTIKAGTLYPIFFAVPVSSQTFENTIQRTFRVFCFGQVKKDKTNENEILSDTESIVHDFVKYLKYDNDDIGIIGDPSMTPFKEDFGDFCAGWECELIIETNFANGQCDAPTK